MSNSVSSLFSYVFAILFLGLGGLVQAANTSKDVSNSTEWLAWPEYCRARYVAYNHGEMNPAWERTVSQKSITKWETSIGGALWESLHHYCRGLVRLHRYQSIPPGDSPDLRAERKHQSGSAISEFRFSLRYRDSNPRFSAVMDASYALALHYAQETENALAVIKSAISAQPDVVEPYSTGYIILREVGRRDEGLELLEACHKATDGGSAENNYFLALEYLDRKDYASARRYAKLAYEQGYPLPGAKRRLMAVGQW